MMKIQIKGWGCLPIIIISFLGIFILCRYSYSLGENKVLREAKNSVKHEVVVVNAESQIEKAQERSWNDFINALIWVESKGICDTIGTKDDVGVLQIRKPIVDDCNRILGYDRFTYEDRLDSLKSVEMFNIIQGHYNPTHDKHFALKIWNSKAPISYHRKVFKKLSEKVY